MPHSREASVISRVRPISLLEDEDDVPSTLVSWSTSVVDMFFAAQEGCPG